VEVQSNKRNYGNEAGGEVVGNRGAILNDEVKMGRGKQRRVRATAQAPAFSPVFRLKMALLRRWMLITTPVKPTVGVGVGFVVMLINFSQTH